MKQQEDTRMRLLHAGMEVFAEVGFHAATTREISGRAGVNLAAIHYHFTDKAGLYRAVFALPFVVKGDAFAQLNLDTVSLVDALASFFTWILPPEATTENNLLQQFMRLHAREEVDPSGVLESVLSENITPNFAQLKRLLCRELGKSQSDIGIEQLAFALIGMAGVFVHRRCAVQMLAPALLTGEGAYQKTRDALVGYAMALIAAERGTA